MKRRFKIVGNFGRPRPGPATFEYDTETGVVDVKPHRSRKGYQFSLALCAEIMVEKAIKAEVREKARIKAAEKRKGKK